MTHDRRHERGTALLELALTLPMLLGMLMIGSELGFLIHDRLIVTNVSREGGSLASRMTVIDPAFLNLLTAGAKPLPITGPNGRVYVTRITSGTTDTDTQPHVTTTLTEGGLAVASAVGARQANMGLPESIYERLIYNADNGTADIAEVTVVEVYYKHRPVTPLQRFMPTLLLTDGDGTILRSKAIF